MEIYRNREGFEITSPRDIGRIRVIHERPLGEFFYRKRRVYEVWSQPFVVVSDSGETKKKITVPDFGLIHRQTGKLTLIEATMLDRTSQNDPKGDHKELMRLFPNCSYVVFYGEQQRKLREWYGIPFMTKSRNGKKGKKR